MQDKPIPSYIPDASLRAWIADALIKLTDLEEHESGPFVNRMLALGPDSKYHSNDVAMAMSYLSYAGLISYRTIQRNGFRLAIKRSAGDEDTRRLLVDNPPLVATNGKKVKSTSPAASASNSTIKVDKKKTKKKKKKKRKDKSEALPAAESKADKPKKKKKKKCCDDPRIVRSKKTGERRCKNCGTKHKAKKKKEE